MLLLSFNDINAQQAPQHSLYMIDPYSINPAYAGFDRSLSANLNYRGQWTGIENNPVHIYANAHLPVYLLDGGAGVHIRRDRTGLINRTEIGISFNRVIPTPYGTFSAGLRVGMQQSRIDGSQIISPDGIYINSCLLYTSPSPRDRTRSRMPSSA